MRPVSLSEINPGMRVTMDRHWARYHSRDAMVHGALALALDDEDGVAELDTTLVSILNRKRVPALVVALQINHQELSVREACRIAGLYVGLHSRTVEKLYYKSQER